MSANQYIQIHTTDLQRIMEILIAEKYTGELHVVTTEDAVYVRDTQSFLLDAFPKTKQQ